MSSSLRRGGSARRARDVPPPRDMAVDGSGRVGSGAHTKTPTRHRRLAVSAEETMLKYLNFVLPGFFLYAELDYA